MREADGVHAAIRLGESGRSSAAHYSETAYPQTKPKPGQCCKKSDRGVVTRASNGRKVRCTAEGSRSRWKYVK